MEQVQKFFGDAARDPRELARALWLNLGVPMAALALFLALWGAVAPRIQTSLGAVPGPAQVIDRKSVV